MVENSILLGYDEPAVPKPSAFEVEIAIEKVETCKSPGTDQIPAELITARDRTIRSEIDKFINSVWNKAKLPKQWKESSLVRIYKNVAVMEAYHCYQRHTNFY